MRLAGIDLNLLTSLDAILDERNVTRAARRLGVTQPAASHALRKLRDLLGDELLVRTPTGMRPTPRALELQPAVRAALAAAEAVLQAAPAFDPARAERTFSIAIADQAAFMLLPRLVQRLVREAPGVRVDVRPVPQERLLEALAGDLDLVIGVFRDAPAGVRDTVLWREGFRCVLRRGSAAARGPFTLERYLSLPHVFIAPRGIPGSPLDDALARAGHRRRILIQIPHFLVAPQLVATSDLVWTAPEILARAFAEQLPLTLRDPPIPVPGFSNVLRTHVRLDRDPGIAWLRATLREVAP
ncbi:MAG: LysR family transcriptional regulator [Deltaproteobacteria bacterium]|nr:LysR family transcriptional regulator [Deltaproteobacteria bacterium]MCW5802842.1 LysR family transcriptional regulator [Deltaproteobacteria bacterium]